MSRRAALTRLATATAGVAVGMLGGAIQYWPVFEYTPWSPRAGGKGWEHTISYSLPPEELVNTYVPEFSGILNAYTGRNGIHLHSEYIGAAVLVLAGLAFAVRRTPWRRQLWFWTGALLVTLLWALGGYTPFFHLIYTLVPGTKYFRAPSTMLYVISFCVATLAAIGVDGALRRAVSRTYLFGWAVLGLFVAMLATSGALSNLASSFAPPQLVPRIDANAAALTLGAWRSFLMVGLVTGAMLLAARGRARAAGWALAGIVALDLWSIERRYWQFSDPAARLYASDPVVDYLTKLDQPGRVAPLAVSEMVGTTLDPYLGGDGGGRADGFMVHGVRSVVGYHGNELGRYITFSGWSDNGIAGDWPRQVNNPNFQRLSNLRFLYTNGSEPPIPGMQRVAGPTRNVAGNTVSLYRFASDNPLAWVTPVAVKAPDENVLATVLDPRFDVGRAALFDTAAAVPTQAVPSQLPAPLDITTRVNSYAPGRIDLQFSAPAPAASTLLVAENYYPGWTATVDGRSAPVGRADYVLIGVPLPAGARTVSLRFTSPRYETGRLITLLALGGAAALALAGAAADRRRVSAIPA